MSYEIYVSSGPHSMKRCSFCVWWLILIYLICPLRKDSIQLLGSLSDRFFSLNILFICILFEWNDWSKMDNDCQFHQKNKWNRNKSYMVVKWRHFNRTTFWHAQNIHISPTHALLLTHRIRSNTLCVMLCYNRGIQVHISTVKL